MRSMPVFRIMVSHDSSSIARVAMARLEIDSSVISSTTAMAPNAHFGYFIIASITSGPARSAYVRELRLDRTGRFLPVRLRVRSRMRRARKTAVRLLPRLRRPKRTMIRGVGSGGMYMSSSRVTTGPR